MNTLRHEETDGLGIVGEWKAGSEQTATGGQTAAGHQWKYERKERPGREREAEGESGGLVDAGALSTTQV